MKAIRLPKVPTHNALYANKVDLKTIKKIDSIVKKTGVSKWMIVDKLLSSALGVKTNNKLDLSTWLKT